MAISKTTTGYVSVVYNKANLTGKELETFHHSVKCFSYLLERGAHLTLCQFCDLIKQHYAVDLKVGESLRVLQKAAINTRFVATLKRKDGSTTTGQFDAECWSDVSRIVSGLFTDIEVTEVKSLPFVYSLGKLTLDDLNKVVAA